LIHVGYPKTGSKFLQDWFARHPRIRYEDGGIAGFRSAEELGGVREAAYHVTSYEGLSAPHESAGEIRVHLAGEEEDAGTRIRERQAEVCARLRALYPGSTILIVTRGFRGIAFSGYSQYVRSGGTLGLAELCRAHLSHPARDGENPFDFDALIRMYAAAFGAANLIVLPYELLRDDPRRFVAELERRLGVEHAEAPGARLNPSLTAEELYWYPRIARAVVGAASPLGARLRDRVHRWYVARTFQNQLRPLVRLLARAAPGRRVSEADLAPEFLLPSRGKATLLRGDPLYAAYAADYLWTEAPVRSQPFGGEAEPTHAAQRQMTRHLIHVGYPKAGSTYLQEWFAKHPQLRYATGGLAGYRTVYEMCHADARPYRYHVTSSEGLSAPHPAMGSFRTRGVGDLDAALDRLPERQAEVCATLRALYPGSRILVVTRGFRAMVYSGYSQYVRTGGALDLGAVCAAHVERCATDDRHHLNYDHLIGLYAEAFGEENVIVLPYELLRDDERRFVAVLEERLGIDHFDAEIGRVNPSLSPEELYWYPRIAGALSAASSRLGPRAHRRVSRWRVERAFTNRLRPLVGLLGRTRPGRAVTPADVPDDILRCCRGKATRLRHDPLYAPYAAEYLWE
jgi:hypothetical protein